MKKALFSILAFACVASAGLVFVGCADTPEDPQQPNQSTEQLEEVVFQEGTYSVAAFFEDGMLMNSNVGKDVVFSNGTGTDWSGYEFSYSVKDGQITMSYAGEHPLFITGNFSDEEIIFDYQDGFKEYYIVLKLSGDFTVEEEEPVQEVVFQEGTYSVAAFFEDGMLMNSNVGKDVVFSNGTGTDWSGYEFSYSVNGSQITMSYAGEHPLTLTGTLSTGTVTVDYNDGFKDYYMVFARKEFAYDEIKEGSYKILAYNVGGQSTNVEYLTIENGALYDAASKTSLPITVDDGVVSVLYSDNAGHQIVLAGHYSNGVLVLNGAFYENDATLVLQYVGDVCMDGYYKILTWEMEDGQELAFDYLQIQNNTLIDASGSQMPITIDDNQLSISSSDGAGHAIALHGTYCDGLIALAGTLYDYDVKLIAKHEADVVIEDGSYQIELMEYFGNGVPSFQPTSVEISGGVVTSAGESVGSISSTGNTVVFGMNLDANHVLTFEGVKLENRFVLSATQSSGENFETYLISLTSI